MRVLLVHGQGYGEGVARHSFGVLIIVRSCECIRVLRQRGRRQREAESRTEHRKQACGGERRRKQGCGIFDWFRAISTSGALPPGRLGGILPLENV